MLGETIIFYNEFNRKIRIEVNPDGEAVKLAILGPDTRSEWIITEREAEKLQGALNRFMNRRHKDRS